MTSTPSTKCFHPLPYPPFLASFGRFLSINPTFFNIHDGLDSMPKRRYEKWEILRNKATHHGTNAKKRPCRVSRMVWEGVPNRSAGCPRPFGRPCETVRQKSACYLSRTSKAFINYKLLIINLLRNLSKFVKNWPDLHSLVICGQNRAPCCQDFSPFLNYLKNIRKSITNHILSNHLSHARKRVIVF